MVEITFLLDLSTLSVNHHLRKPQYIPAKQGSLFFALLVLVRRCLPTPIEQNTDTAVEQQHLKRLSKGEMQSCLGQEVVPMV